MSNSEIPQQQLGSVQLEATSGQSAAVNEIGNGADSFARRHFRRNVSLIVTENAGFIISITFVGLTTVMPAFVTRLGGSAFLVGLISACQIAGMLLTQIVGAGISVGKPRMRRYLITPLYFGRPTMLFIGALTFVLGTRANSTLLALMFIALFLFFSMDGIASVPWYELIGKTIPPANRGRMFGAAQIGGGLGGIAAGLVVSRVLDSPNLKFPDNFALLFLISGTLFVLNILPFVFVKEPVVTHSEPASAETTSIGGFVKSLGEILKADRTFRRIVSTRLLCGISFAVFPFYVLYMIHVSGYGSAQLGFFTSAQVFGGFAAGLIVGWIADRLGTRLVVRLATIVGIVIPAIGLAMNFFPEVVGHSFGTGVVVFVLIGVAGSMNMIGFANYVLGSAPVKRRPTYMGLFNTMTGVLLVASPILGWLLDETSFAVLFAVAFVASALSLLVSIGLKSPVR